MNAVSFVCNKLSLPSSNVKACISLLESGCTVPFISRYRKEATGNLDEVKVAAIQKYNLEFEELLSRKKFILQSLADQNISSKDLLLSIENCFDPLLLEALYLPYRKKLKTKGTVAKQLGLEPLAKRLFEQNSKDIEADAEQFLSDEVENTAFALEGACHIISEWINEHQDTREQLRSYFLKNASLRSKQSRKKLDPILLTKYQSYTAIQEPLNRCPSHRLLAILRAEKEGVISIAIEVEDLHCIDTIEKIHLKSYNSCRSYMKKAIQDAYDRLLHPSLSSYCLQVAKEKADAEAIAVFADNAKQLLLAPPVGTKRIMAIDPGFRTGCKLVCLDESGDLLYHTTIFPNEPLSKWEESKSIVLNATQKYKVEAIAIGNGTASRETENFIKKIAFEKSPELFIVNESGASIYSASDIAREEFPNLDLTYRGAVSIGRRLADPLAELVKIDPKSIGVGQYQHDVNPTKLKQELDTTVIHCVNKVGVNLNTASRSLLTYVSGIGPKLAESIVAFRSQNGPFKSRSALKKVPRLGEKAFEQSAAFLKIPQSDNPLDNSFVHPESYAVVSKMAKKANCTVADLVRNKNKLNELNPNDFVDNATGLITVQDILNELEKPGLDPREKAEAFSFSPLLQKFEDVKEGMVVPGVVRNITKFGCFVDIGIKESGLVHISQISKNFISSVDEVVKLDQKVEVKIIGVDRALKRIQLSMVLD
jgi:uncharacterized protein